MLNEEVEALLYEPVYLEEVGAYQNGDRVLYVQFGSAVLLDGRLLAIRLTFVHRDLPGTASAANTFQSVVALLLLLELLHREDVVEQPFKNDGVAVDANIYLILV